MSIEFLFYTCIDEVFKILLLNFTSDFEILSVVKD